MWYEAPIWSCFISAWSDSEDDIKDLPWVVCIDRYDSVVSFQIIALVVDGQQTAPSWNGIFQSFRLSSRCSPEYGGSLRFRIKDTFRLRTGSPDFEIVVFWASVLNDMGDSPQKIPVSFALLVLLPRSNHLLILILPLSLYNLFGQFEKIVIGCCCVKSHQNTQLTWG